MKTTKIQQEINRLNKITGYDRFYKNGRRVYVVDRQGIVEYSSRASGGMSYNEFKEFARSH